MVYIKFARAASEGAGGTVIAITTVGGKLTTHENCIEQSTVLIEFDSYEAAVAAYECSAYQEALVALDGGADRDIRIFEGK